MLFPPCVYRGDKIGVLSVSLSLFLVFKTCFLFFLWASFTQCWVPTLQNSTIFQRKKQQQQKQQKNNNKECCHTAEAVEQTYWCYFSVCAIFKNCLMSLFTGVLHVSLLPYLMPSLQFPLQLCDTHIHTRMLSHRHTLMYFMFSFH